MQRGRYVDMTTGSLPALYGLLFKGSAEALASAAALEKKRSAGSVPKRLIRRDGNARDQVVDAMRKIGAACTASDIQAALGYGSVQIVNYHLQKLEALGLVKRRSQRRRSGRRGGHPSVLWSIVKK